MEIFLKFKSTPQNYEKEKIGVKSNTVRKIYPEEFKFKRIKCLLEELENSNNRIRMLLEMDLWIEITNTETGESFERHIWDITEFDGYYIISW
ncbi:MAG: hypothetical protein ACRDDY_10750 [Clostridium sp.]|uniref:hypothetical protein n=1 Tax=Clostridium sp. TaxID=1506 RepID=UPI003EE50869